MDTRDFDQKSCPLLAACGGVIADGVWEEAKELEGVLYATSHASFLVQHENKFLAGFQKAVADRMKVMLGPDSNIFVLNTAAEGFGGRLPLPRVARPDDDLTPVGRRAKQRAFEETVSRFGAFATDEEIVDYLLDVRLAGLLGVREMFAENIGLEYDPTKEESPALKKAKSLVRKKYIDFGMRVKEFEKPEKPEKPPDVPQVVEPPKKHEPPRDMMGTTAPLFRPRKLIVQQPEQVESEAEVLGKEFDRVILRWLDRIPDGEGWNAYLDEEHRKKGGDAEYYDLMNDLVYADMGKLYMALEAEKEFGHLPKMAIARLSGNMSSSFVERMNSCAKLIFTDGRTLLSDEELDMVVVLRMNRKFMEYMRGRGAVGKRPRVKKEVKEEDT